MRKIFFTAGQLAALHHLNKRTLHYYDGIGLFSPDHKGENGYRYYTSKQSAELENILALREMGMSIDEIIQYLKRPSSEAFLKIAEDKTREIEAQIRRLKELASLLSQKRDALKLCSRISDGHIEAVHLPEQTLLLTPLDEKEAEWEDMERIMRHLQLAWECNPNKTGCGTYLSLDKVKRGEFTVYDGLYTPVSRTGSGDGFITRPAGRWLTGYSVGSWDKIPDLYRKILSFAQKEGLALTGNCYECGLNEFAIGDREEYVTQIMVQCEP